VPDPGTAPGLYVRLRQSAPFPLDVELTCAPGELVALFGPSGSGKTSVLRAIAGLHLPPDALVRCGNATWTDTGAGHVIPPQRRSIGMVFQDYALFPHMSVREQMLAAMSGLPRQAREARVAQLAAAVHLAEFIDRKPASLSGGQQQRAAIARALAREPAVLLLDEPFASVDRPLRDALHREFLALRHELRVPIVLVTHDFDDVTRLASHVVMLERGAVVASGSVAAVTAANRLPGVSEWREPAVALDGIVAAHDVPRRLTTLAMQGAELLVPRLDAAIGAGVRVSIAAREVILATRRPVELSIHNVLAARITGVEPALQTGSALVRLAAGGMPLLAVVTADAVEKLRLVPGAEVFALVKAMAIDTFG
jgi:molybdate transport system ATP-binding protein